MEWKILFLGTEGSGKTSAIRAISDVEVVSTEAVSSEKTAPAKGKATMDLGGMNLEGGDRLVLHGAPGQERFGFMWERLMTQVKGVVLLVNLSRKDPVADLAHYLDRIRDACQGAAPPLVIGVTHGERVTRVSFNDLRVFLRESAKDLGGAKLPLLRVDARQKKDIQILLLTLMSMLEFVERFPNGRSIPAC